MANDQQMPNDQIPMSNNSASGRNGSSYDLEERTAIFGESVIALAKRSPQNAVTLPLIGQLVRSGTSVGANYCEADEAESRKEFRYRISLCKREAKETRFNIRMLVAAEPCLKTEARPIYQESNELVRIFAAIIRRR
jgi:four helix bundle protein